MKRITIIAFIFFICLPGLFAMDFGIIFDSETSDYNEEHNYWEIEYRSTFSPWISFTGEKTDFFLSLGLSSYLYGLQQTVPELHRMELSAKLSDSIFLKAGRFTWQDVSGMVAKGSYDGADIQFDLQNVCLGASVFYTGFLFKDTANINISPDDPKDYSLFFDGNADTYFAPRRLLASVYGDFPGFPNKRGNLSAGLMAQFDFSDAEEKYHTQYLLLRYTMAYKTFDIFTSGAAGLEHTQENGIKPSFAFSFEGGALFSGGLTGRLSLGFRWASGNGDFTAAFFSVVNEAQGIVLKPNLSGIMAIYANYDVRFLRSLSAGLGVRYFLRTDFTTFTDIYTENDSYALGTEITGSVLFVPFSDFSISLSFGIFVPQPGGAMQDSAPIRRAVTVGTIFSF